MKLLEEGKREMLSWSLRYLTHFPCPTPRLERGKSIQYAIDDFFSVNPKLFAMRAAENFPCCLLAILLD